MHSKGYKVITELSHAKETTISPTEEVEVKSKVGLTSADVRKRE